MDSILIVYRSINTKLQSFLVGNMLLDFNFVKNMISQKEVSECHF